MSGLLEFLTWASVILLGPGALAVFVWFLVDLRGIVRSVNEDSPD
jgi:hypothetical protein